MTNIRDFTFMEELSKLVSVNINTSPVEKIKFNQNNNIEEFLITGSLISDASVFSGLNKNISGFSVLFNKVPVANLKILNNFKDLTQFSIVAPELDLSFLSGLDANIESLWVGGTDNLDLNEIIKFNNTLTQLQIYNIENIDLTPIDKLENIESVILFNVKNSVKGTKTQPDNSIFVDLVFNWDLFNWFEYEK